MQTEAALLEAILFLESEPLDIQSLCKISELEKDIVEESIARLTEKYQSDEYGIELEQISGGYLLVPKKTFWSVLKDRYGKKNENRLSKAAMETLSIIAYKQPITRAEIEAFRGVGVDNMMRILLDRNLVKEVGKKDIPGKPIQYGTTREFLKYFRLNSIADLPKLDEQEESRFTLAR